MTTQTNGTGGAATLPTSPNFGEAPASATVDAISPSGRRWLLTTRAATVGELMQRVEYLDRWLSDHAWTAGAGRAQAPHNGNGQAAQEQGEAAPICAIHKTPLVKRSKDGRSWWSCSEKLDTGEWCPYRPRK